MIKSYFKNLYSRTMKKAYGLANDKIKIALSEGGRCLDCGAYDGYKYEYLKKEIALKPHMYFGLEWNSNMVDISRGKGINVMKSDLNKKLEFDDRYFRCIVSLSVLEHLLYPCQYLNECFRCLEDDGSLIVLTPNISTFFTIALLLVGKMPSSGPHPDSDMLMRKEEVIKVSGEHLITDTEAENPVHRHLIVFSYRVLKKYLEMIGFQDVKGYGFGLYPFPNFVQPILERMDPYHCHQMVFTAKKSAMV